MMHWVTGRIKENSFHISTYLSLVTQLVLDKWSFVGVGGRNGLKTSESACYERKCKVLPVEGPQEEMILPVSLTQPKAGRIFIHVLHRTFHNLCKCPEDESGDPSPASAPNLLCNLKCLFIYTMKSLDMYVSKVLISNTKML